MSRHNPIVERIKAHRAALEAEITTARATLAALIAEAASLDRLMTEPAPVAEPPPRPTRKVRVAGHQRTVGGTDPGTELPITGGAAE